MTGVGKLERLEFSVQCDINQENLPEVENLK